MKKLECSEFTAEATPVYLVKNTFAVGHTIQDANNFLLILFIFL